MRKTLRVVLFTSVFCVGNLAWPQPARAEYGDEAYQKKTAKVRRLAIISIVVLAALGGSAFVGLNQWDKRVQRRKMQKELLEKAERGML